MQPALRFLTAGSVDDGKSTLIGRLLFDSRAILAGGAVARGVARQRGHLVVHDVAELVQQPPDQGGLAVVDRAGRGQAQEWAHRDPPCASVRRELIAADDSARH